jgi:hypothetical protein
MIFDTKYYFHNNFFVCKSFYIEVLNEEHIKNYSSDFLKKFYLYVCYGVNFNHIISMM